MDFKEYIRKYSPPLTTEQVEAIATEHTKQVGEAVAKAKGKKP